MTNFMRSRCSKLRWFYFLNTGIVILATSLWTCEFLGQVLPWRSKNIKTVSLDADLTYNVFFIFAYYPIGAIMRFLNYYWFYKRFQRWWYRRKANSEAGKTSPKTLNVYVVKEIFSNLAPQIDFTYSRIMSLLWITAFYAPLLPVIVPLSGIAIGLDYWALKYELCKRSAMPKYNLGLKLVKDQAVLLNLIPFFYILGSICFQKLKFPGENLRNSKIFWAKMGFLGITLIYYLISWIFDFSGKLFRFFHPEKKIDPKEIENSNHREDFSNKVKFKDFQHTATYVTESPAKWKFDEADHGRALFDFSALGIGVGHSETINLSGRLGAGMSGIVQNLR